ncbi:hypothetical protein [Sphingobacterium luzhongxinii]|uniref:hypothetical protein n=1 Tax=Sphingobacterium luzhongxinii TaxID=2654181 RepID=UPI0013DAEF22|nr:hypothetical protein [Sphingobacterium sp. xlx-73]
MKTLFKHLIIGIGIASLAISTGVHATGKQPISLNVKSNNLAEVHEELKGYKSSRIIYVPGLTPKEYGMLYGNGKSKKYKTNKKHRSFKAKLKRSQY